MNQTIITNGTGGLGDVIVFINDASGNLFMPVVMIGILTIILLISMKRLDFPSSLTLASWLTFTLCLPLSLGHMIGIIWPIGLLIMAALGTIYLYTTR